MELDLWKVFDNVNDWLRYAERKNAYMLTLIGLQLTLIRTFDVPMNNWQIVASIVMLGLCLLVTIGSFYPKTALTRKIYFWAEGSDQQREDDNLLFYGHIRKYSVAEYLKAVENRYGCPTENGKQYYRDLCGQIVANANIASTKFTIFKAATVLAVGGQALFVWSFLRAS